jgi:hypothetical protein
MLASANFTTRDVCPVCSSRQYDVFYSCEMTKDPVRGFIESHYQDQGRTSWSLLEQAEFALCECAQCGLVFQKNVPTDRMLENLYTKMIDPGFLSELERSRLTLHNFSTIAGELMVLFKKTGKHPGQIRFLDFGFGSGRWARVARALGAEVFVTEIGDEKYKTAASLGITVIPDEAVDTETFDIVHTEQVFEHLVEPGREFRRLARATTGLMKIAVPRGGDLRNHIAKAGVPSCSPFRLSAEETAFGKDEYVYAAILPLEHLNAFTPQTIAYLAKQNGMVIRSRVRQADVMIEQQNLKGFLKSAARVGKEAARAILKPNTGYYLLQPERAA